MKKPFKGKIYHWKKIYFNREETEKYYRESAGLGYCISGFRSPEPRFGNYWLTSWVMKHYKNGSIETRNSRYKLIGKEKESKSRVVLYVTN